MSVPTYDPSQIVITLGGNRLTGYAKGQFLSVKRDAENFGDEAGTDGIVTRVKKLDRRASIELTLSQSSRSNDLLSSLADLDDRTGTGVGVFQVKDLNGTTLLTAPNAWVSKIPDPEFSDEISGRMWTIRVDRLFGTIGGIVAT